MRYILFALVFAMLTQTWFWLSRADSYVDAPVSEDIISSLSYALYKGFDKTPLSDEEIQRDLEILARYTRKIRVYSTDDAERLLEIIERDKLKFTLDVGLDITDNLERNVDEITKTLELIKKYRKLISSIVVGNEVLLRKDVEYEALIGYIATINMATKIPVTTAEVWSLWLDYPSLAENVDFVSIHILPYWEGVSFESFKEYAVEKYTLVKNAFPKKKIVIGEFGWPSHGYNNKKSIASQENQIKAIRGFLKLAKENGWEYNLIEAFDQQWKGGDEGSVGAYWGIFNSDRILKFSLRGKVQANPNWKEQMIAGLLIGMLLTFFGLRNQRINLNHALIYALVAQGIAFGLVMAATYPFMTYMNLGEWIIWSIGSLLMIPLTIITLAKVNELFKCTIGRAPERLIPLNLRTERVPFVSIHVPAYKEQPAVLKATLLALSNLRYTNYEVLVVINNTPEEYYWKPIQEYCETLGEKFKFLNITCTGFKAGALNEALKYTNKDAEILAVIDADYVVSPNWLVDLVPLFDDQKVAIVQAPQDHRDGEESLIKTTMNAEYAGFFDIGMIERNEENAIVVHGTMLLVRLSALYEVGGWNSDTIVEDSELGLRLFEAGYHAHYTNRRYGYGLLPDTVEAYKNQRHRWAYGAIQILKKHKAHFYPSSKTLTPQQKHHFITGWFFWLSDAFGVIAAILNMLWVPFILFVGVAIPTLPLTLPIITAFGVNILHAFILYKTRVKVGFKESLLSALASMSLQLVIFKAVYEGFVKEGLPFKRTEKGGNTKKRNAKNPVLGESAIAFFLTLSFASLFATNKNGVFEVYVFAGTLVVQSVPYYSAVILRIIELYSAKQIEKKRLKITI